MTNLKNALIENGYVKKHILGMYHLIGSDIIKEVTDVFLLNINQLCKDNIYMSKFKNNLNKVEIINEGIEVYSKGCINFEIKENMIFTYIQ